MSIYCTLFHFVEVKYVLSRDTEVSARVLFHVIHTALDKVISNYFSFIIFWDKFSCIIRLDNEKLFIQLLNKVSVP
jgi:hypothetical protein